MSGKSSYSDRLRSVARSGHRIWCYSRTVRAMWKCLAAQQPVAPAGSGFASVTSYFGATLILLAMGSLFALVSSTSGAIGSMLLSIIYFSVFFFGAERFGKSPNLRVPSGLLYVLATSMTPFLISSLQLLFWKGADNYLSVGLASALATLVVGNVLTARARISFVCLPALLAGGSATYFAMALLSEHNTWSSTYESWGMVGNGLFAILMSLIIDRRSNEDYSFWGYGVGAISFWVGLTMVVGGDGWGLYALVGLVSMFVSLLLSRNVFAFTGGFAVLAYLTHISYTYFSNSIGFFFSMGVVGLLTMLLGVWYVRNAEQVQKVALKLVPKGMRKGLPGDKPEDK